MFPFGDGAKQQQPMQQQSPSQFGTMETINMAPKDTDVDFAKFVLDTKKFEIVFNKMFAGWREITDYQNVTVFGKTITKEGKKYVVDLYARLMNESGANYVLNSVMPLISEGATSSNLRYSDIYWQWRARLVTIRAGMLGSCHIAEYICKKCSMRTDNYPIMKDHQIDKHNGIEEVVVNGIVKAKGTIANGFFEIINPYEFNANRIGELQATLANFAVYTMKAQGGFAMRQITENIGSANINRQNGMMPYYPMPQQPQGILGRLRNIL